MEGPLAVRSWKRSTSSRRWPLIHRAGQRHRAAGGQPASDTSSCSALQTGPSSSIKLILKPLCHGNASRNMCTARHCCSRSKPTQQATPGSLAGPVQSKRGLATACVSHQQECHVPLERSQHHRAQKSATATRPRNGLRKIPTNNKHAQGHGASFSGDRPLTE